MPITEDKTDLEQRIQHLLLERECSGLRVPVSLRIGLTFLQLFLELQNSKPGSSIMFGLMATYGLSNVYFLYLLKRRRYVRWVGLAGSGLDSIVMVLSIMTLYYVDAAGALPPDTLNRTIIPVAWTLIIAVNTLSLRGLNPLVVTIAALMTQLWMFFATWLDPRVIWTSDFIELYAGPGHNVSDQVMRIIMLAVVGAAMSYAAYIGRRTVIESLETAVAHEETLRKQADLVTQQKLEAVGSMVAGISHELNTPLGALKSAADTQTRALTKLTPLVEDKKASRLLKASTASVATMAQAAERINVTVKTLKAYARLDQSDLQEAKLSECIESALAMLPQDLRDKFSYSAESLPSLSCIPGELNQAFRLLMARITKDATDDIRLTLVAEPDSQVVSFTYPGSPLPLDDILKTKVAFSAEGDRVEATIDLAVASSVVHRHNGTLSAGCEPESGHAVLHIRLPQDAEPSA